MRWRTKHGSEWTRWFAWFPVCLEWRIDGNNEYIWLEHVERKVVISSTGYEAYEYREAA